MDRQAKLAAMFVAIAVLVHLEFGSSAIAQSADQRVSPGENEVDAEVELSPLEQRLADATNAFRVEHRRSKLKSNAQLQNAARYFARYMSRTGKYGHEADGHKPAERVKQHKYEHCLVAENIAYREVKQPATIEATSDYFFKAWRESESHRRNMLDADFTEVGVAVEFNAETKKYYAVQLLARPTSATIKFQIVNETKMPVGYRLSSHAEALEIKARVVRTHYSCRPLTLRLAASTDHVTRVVHNGKYVIRNVEGNIRLIE